MKNLIPFLAVLLFLPGLSEAQSVQFTDVTEESGIDYDFKSWGLSWGDADGDGWPDLFTGNHYREADANPPSFWRNLRDGTFEESTPPYGTKADLHGASWMDFDNDGDQDILITCGGKQKNIFLVNEGGGVFVDQALPRGVEDSVGRGRCPLWVDVDQDGLLDLFLLKARGEVGQDPSSFYRQNEDGTFLEITEEAGFVVPDASLFATLSDVTGDRELDLVVQMDGGTLVYDISKKPFEEGNGFAAPLVRDLAVGDFDGDLRPDLYQVRRVVRSEVRYVSPEHLSVFLKPITNETAFWFRAQGDDPVTFRFPFHVESGGWLLLGGASQDPGAPDSLILFPGDPGLFGYPDIEPGVDVGIGIGYFPDSAMWKVGFSYPTKSPGFVVEVESESPIEILRLQNVDTVRESTLDELYLNGPNGFVEYTPWSGLDEDVGSAAVVAGDFDNDMDLDLYMINSVIPPNSPNVLWLNQGDGFFVKAEDAAGAAGTSKGQADCAAAADYNRDGFLDILVTNGQGNYETGPYQLFRNEGNDNHWVQIDLEGRSANRDGIGSSVIVWAGGRGQLRERSGGMHVFSQDFKRLHFGLGQNTTIDSVWIRWPGGCHQRLGRSTVDTIVTIQQVEEVDCLPDPGLPTASTLSSLNILPNPTVSSIQVKLHPDFVDGEWALYNLNGQVLRSGGIEIWRFSVNDLQLPPGEYVFEARSRLGTKVERRKVIVAGF